MRRRWSYLILWSGAVIGLCVLTLDSCSTTAPRDVDNACAIFEARPDWYAAARATERKWGTPVSLQLAIIRVESGFRDDARPPRDTFLGVPLWYRLSNAYGYAQAKDETWDWYRTKTGNSGADRDDFQAASDFIGWYTDVSRRTLGISKWDPYNQYLAYHEGHGGWKRQTYLDKPAVMQVARRVDAYTRTYGAQLGECKTLLNQELAARGARPKAPSVVAAAGDGHL
jgi:hypothetical protein